RGAASGEGSPCQGVDEGLAPPDDIHSGHEEHCQADITGVFQPSQGVWQDDYTFADRSTKQLTQTGPAEWTAELPMVAQRRTLLFGPRAESHGRIVIQGVSDGSQDETVAVRFRSD